MKENEALKNCPFCGGGNIGSGADDENSYSVYCNTCFACIEEYTTQEVANEKWNTRQSQQVVAVSELKPILFKLIEHNTKDQLEFGGHKYTDTRHHLTVGKTYAGFKEIHSWHTYVFIGDFKFNSLCFEELNPQVERAEVDVEKLAGYLKSKHNELTSGDDSYPDWDKIAHAIKLAIENREIYEKT